MRRKPQIIIRRQVNNALAVEGTQRSLLVVEHPQLEVRPLCFEFVELIGEK
jgi:hypothetical protein